MASGVDAGNMGIHHRAQSGGVDVRNLAQVQNYDGRLFRANCRLKVKERGHGERTIDLDDLFSLAGAGTYVNSQSVKLHGHRLYLLGIGLSKTVSTKTGSTSSKEMRPVCQSGVVMRDLLSWTPDRSSRAPVEDGVVPQFPWERWRFARNRLTMKGRARRQRSQRCKSGHHRG